MYQLQPFDWPHFLQHYWQKKPLLIKAGFNDFVDPIDKNDLAGLAQEEGIDARIIRHNDEQWSLSHGPFEDYTPECIGQWSLLVQNVDRYLPDASALMDAFNTLPLWRMDDVMVSFSVPGGSVGCHLDQYDVFICQGEGQRHWRVYPQHDTEEQIVECGLRQVSVNQAPIIDAVLEAGDILYIPPGFAHHGIAITECLNYSVGFRAPTQTQILDSVLAAIESKVDFSPTFYTEQSNHAHGQHQHLSSQSLERLRGLAMDALNGDDFEHAMLKQASQRHIDEQWLAELQYECESDDIAAYIMNGGVLQRTGGITPIQSDKPEKSHIWYIQGEMFEFSSSNSPLINEFMTSLQWSLDEGVTQLPNELIVFVKQCVSLGWWQLID